MSIGRLVLALLLAGGAPLAAQEPGLDLTMTFDFQPDAPTTRDVVSVLLGFDGGGVGVDFGSTVLSDVTIDGTDVLVTITVQPPPPSEITVPSFEPLSPLVELGTFPAGEYQVRAEMAGYTGQAAFTVVPEPPGLLLAALAGLLVAGSRRLPPGRH